MLRKSQTWGMGRSITWKSFDNVFDVEWMLM